MKFIIKYESDNDEVAMPDTDSIDYARGTLKEFYNFYLLYKSLDDYSVIISNVLVWDAYRMLLLTEFPEVLPHTEWYIDNRKVEMTNTMSYKEYAPEHGLAGTILATIVRHNIEQRKKAAKKEVE